MLITTLWRLNVNKVINCCSNFEIRSFVWESLFLVSEDVYYLLAIPSTITLERNSLKVDKSASAWERIWLIDNFLWLLASLKWGLSNNYFPICANLLYKLYSTVNWEVNSSTKSLVVGNSSNCRMISSISPIFQVLICLRRSPSTSMQLMKTDFISNNVMGSRSDEFSA